MAKISLLLYGQPPVIIPYFFCYWNTTHNDRQSTKCLKDAVVLHKPRYMATLRKLSYIKKDLKFV